MRQEEGRARYARGLATVAALLASAHLAFAGDDEMQYILGPCTGEFCTPGSMPGNDLRLTQQGAGNTASVEQRAILGAYANSANISQSGNGNYLGLTQTGGGNAAGITQSGDGNSLTLSQQGGASTSISQTGNNLGLVVNQPANTTIGVTQLGNGTSGAAPVVVTTFFSK